MPAHALNEPNSIVISKSLADKYFGKNTPAVGKTLRTVYDVYKVTGVIEDVPQNSHFRFDMLISWSSLSTRTRMAAETTGAISTTLLMYY